ncbi:TRAP transporter large permease [Nesterenkonia sp. HG001]|uniref:TRAP transporter large permease n=1 Tax=Nesterenkonia sp. HG001 TaxID=2983207 RepID=UPI002AC5E60A|nr:TRAP transporter large permease [Nesterenkonia sp. HG001]MDZ5076602.1 TRAP transporter large permease [Nesterenkonia sp. HG001]
MPALAQMFGYLFGAIAIGVPIAFALLFCAMVTGMQLGSAADSQVMAAQLMRGTDSIAMMALPFFILTGELMNRGGLTHRIIDLCKATVGRVRGGLGYVTIIACLLFGSLVGSAVASTAALGAILIPMMAKAGYDRARSTALTASANLVTPVMPPSVPLIVYGATAGVSIQSLFLGGLAPALYLTLTMCAVWFVISRTKENVQEAPTEPPTFTELSKLALGAFWALLLPVIILVGLRGGVFTATEAGVVAVVYATIVGGVIYRELSIRTLFEALRSTAKMSAVVMFLAAAAQVLAYYMTISGLPDIITDTFSGLADNPTLLVISLMLFVILIGTVLDVIPTILIVTPIVVPLLEAADVDLVYFGIIFTLANVIGLITPPVGPSLNVACAVGKVKIDQVIRPVLPYLLAQTSLVLLMGLFPEMIMVPLEWLSP